MDASAQFQADAPVMESNVEAVSRSAQSMVPPGARSTPAQMGLVVLGAIAFLYFTRSVVLPIFLACIAGMTLKPLVRWLSYCRVPTAFSSAVVLCLMAAATGAGFSQLGRPALAWMNQAPQHMTELRLRVQRLFPRLGRISQAAAAVTNLGATEEERLEAQKAAPTVELKDGRGAGSILTWTGSLLMGTSETLVLLYLILASGDMFLQKLVHVMPTFHDKKRAVEISREIQQNISNYLFSITLTNIGLGLAVSGGLYFIGVPKAAMWGMLVAVLNFAPYFGPFVGIILLAAVGLLTFDTLWRGLLPPGWYLLLHLLESNLVTPVLLGRRLTLNPVVIFVSLIFWTWLWGMPGALLSAPILVSVKVICDRIPRLSHVSELLTS